MDRLRTGVSAPTFGQLSEKLEAPAAQGACDEGVENVVLPITATGLACEGTRSTTETDSETAPETDSETDPETDGHCLRISHRFRISLRFRISHCLRFRHRLRFSRQPPPGPAGWFRLVAKTRHAVADNGDAVAKTGNAVTALGSHLPDLAACDRRMVPRVPKVVTRVRKMVTRSPNMVTRYPQLVRKSPNPLDLPATTPGPYPKWVTTSETRGSTRPGGSMTPALAGRCVFRNRKCTLCTW